MLCRHKRAVIGAVWSIKQLRESAEVDGKAQYSMEKLKLFRAFYIMVSFVHVTMRGPVCLQSTDGYRL
jgi:hypothetical protein